MTRIALLLSLLVACSSDVSGVDLGDAGVSDAPPDATAPTTYCHHVTRGLVLGDSIARDLFVNGSPVLQVHGDKVFNAAENGATVYDQFFSWRTSFTRGSADLDWIYIQCGVSDIINGNVTVQATVGTMAAFLEDIHTVNPHTVVFLGAMDPARALLDTLAGPSRYPMWLDVQSGYATLGAITGISVALNDGMDNLTTACDSGDHLHLTNDCDRTSAAILRTWIDFAFPDVPCAP